MHINQLLKNEKGYSARGAQMGRRDQRGDPDRAYRFKVQRIRFVDYDYDTGGAYWGGGMPLWCAWCDDEEDGHVRMFIRSYDREGAKNSARHEYPNAKFYR